jgi:putative redox protein
MPLEISVSQHDAHITAASVRQHIILSDTPVASGGTDAGPRARELFLMSIGSCFMKTLQDAIAARKIDINDLQVQVIGHENGHPNRFERIEMNISASYDDEATMLRLVTIAERGCTLTNTIRHAVDIHVSVSRIRTEAAAK